jgi:serine/threonine protein kinase
VVVSPGSIPRYWPSARHFTEAIQCPSVCFSHPLLRPTLPAVDRLGMPLVTSGQFAYVYKLKSMNGDGDFAVRCFRGYLGDRDHRYRAIQEHLRSAPVSHLLDFTYAPEGLLVGGNRFPILFMKWIEGPTLDLYIREMLNRPDVLLHLSEEWLRLLSALRTSGIAHGDLQHGNIIVEHGQLRLVDHDGIFVTKMTGWTASEVGHQHYQHPSRNAQHFDAKLDRFSSLVIYLSLLSLAERPGLWQEHHDENLLFTKADFANPAASTLFSKIRELGPEHSRLAEVLADAANGPPTNVPCLLDLVKTKTTLPSWMTAPADIDATTKTREVIRAESPADRKTIRWIPWQEKTREPSMPSTPASATIQTLFGGAPPPATPSVLDPQDILANTVMFSKEFLRRYFLVWYWGAYILLKFLGFNFFLSVFSALVLLAVGCLTFGVVRAVDESLKAKRPKIPPIWSPPPAVAAPPDPQPQISSSWNPHVNLPLTPATTLVSEPFVGNLVLGIYHLENCDWVDRISVKNRVGFSTASEAISHGFKPCRICSPVA